MPVMKPDQRGATMKILILYHKKNHLDLNDSSRRHRINIFINRVCRKSEHKLNNPVCVLGYGVKLIHFFQRWSNKRCCLCATNLT